MDTCGEHGFIVTSCRCPGPHEVVVVDCPPYCRGRIQDKGIASFMEKARAAPKPLPLWAGSEPIEHDTMHPDCDCTVCCPPCSVPGCWSFDVTARMVPTDGTARFRARVLLCDEHGGSQPTEAVWAAGRNTYPEGISDGG